MVRYGVIWLAGAAVVLTAGCSANTKLYALLEIDKPPWPTYDHEQLRRTLDLGTPCGYYVTKPLPILISAEES